jgi:hypothetical protein
MYYEEDRFNPVNEDNDPHDDNFSNKKKKNDILSEIKKLDKGFHKLKHCINKAENRKVNIELYVSGNIGTRIRNAVTGIRYNYKIGSLDEDLLFSVKISTGELGSIDGSLFYDNPEQYERHFFTKLNPDIKTRWYDKNLEARRRNALKTT